MPRRQIHHNRSVPKPDPQELRQLLESEQPIIRVRYYEEQSLGGYLGVLGGSRGVGLVELLGCFVELVEGCWRGRGRGGGG